MKADPFISSFYGGVVPRDGLPLQTEKPTFYIVNQDTSDKTGSHWIVVFNKDSEWSEYYDPLGKHPADYFTLYLTSQSKNYKYNMKRCQSYWSNLCGQYCLFFCYFRSRGYSMEAILDMFDKDLVYNDLIVYLFYKSTT